MVSILSIPTGLIFDLSVIIIITTAIAYFLKLVRQPLIIAYVIAGIVLGPLGFNLFKDMNWINSLSEIGIAFLLFIVGLELDLNKIKSVGAFSVFGGILQVLITAATGFFVAIYFGFSQVSAMYIGLALAFSSTMLVVKILKDREEIDTLHGRLMIGLLVMQDIIVVFALSMVSTLSFIDYSFVLLALFKVLVFMLAALIASKFFLPRIFRFAAKSDELLFLCSLSMCFLFSLLAYKLGFSIAIGSFMAGIMLGSLPYGIDIAGMIGGLKNFFVTIFFVSLGMQLVFIPLSMILILAVLLLLTIIVKPLIIMVLSSLFGYEKRTSFLTSFGLGQISEFSLIMASFGFYTSSQISPNVFSLIVFMTLISMILTSYVMDYDSWIYNKLSRYIGMFEKLSLAKKQLIVKTKKKRADVILFGCHRMGSVFLKSFRVKNSNVFVVDHNPEIIKMLSQRGIDCIYGDCTNPEVLRKIDFKNAKLVISAIPSLELNEFLLSHVKAKKKKIAFIATQNHLHEALDLYEKGADYVILPHISTSESIFSLISKMLSNKAMIKDIRNRHIKHLLSLDVYG